MPTIADVAREAGVGLGTASRALNGAYGVAEATRTRVRAAAERLGYRRSPIARAFSRRRTNTLEIIVPIFTRYFNMEVLRGVGEALADTDYSVVIRAIEHAEERDRVLSACCGRGRADGALFISMTPDARLAERLLRERIPTVLVDAELSGFMSVSVDHALGEASAVRHCIELGHHRIALIDHYENPLAPVSPTDRQRGYRAAMAEAGLSVQAAYERIADLPLPAGAEVAAALLRLPAPPTAILTGGDMHAVGVLELARRMNLRVGAGLSIVGYNDIALARHFGLTTVRVPMRQMGYHAAAMLVAALEDSSGTPQAIRLATELVVRQTSGPPQPSGQ